MGVPVHQYKSLGDVKIKNTLPILNGQTENVLVDGENWQISNINYYM